MGHKQEGRYLQEVSQPRGGRQIKKRTYWGLLAGHHGSRGKGGKGHKRKPPPVLHFLLVRGKDQKKKN